MLSLKKKTFPALSSPSGSTVSFASTTDDASDCAAFSDVASSTQYKDDTELFAALNGKYEMREVLGRGGSARVFGVVERSTGLPYACKLVSRNGRMNDTNTMETECAVLNVANHRNVVALHEILENANTKCMVIELATGTLSDVLVQQSAPAGYTEDIVAGYYRQVLEGVEYLHSNGVIHRDLKSDNILCVEQAKGQVSVKISDFGLSAIVSDKVKKVHPGKEEQARKSFRSLKEQWGTYEYFAPEVHNKAYGFQADVWSLGCILYELLTGVAAFSNKEQPTSFIDKWLLNGGKKVPRMFERREGFKALSPDAQDLLRGMLKRNARKRLSVAECLAHPWVTGRSSQESASFLTQRFTPLATAYKTMKTHVEAKARRHVALVKEVEAEIF